MPNIEELDPNFKVKQQYDEKGITFRNAEEEPFKIYGVTKQETEAEPNGQYCRMDHKVSKEVSFNVTWLNYNTAGGRVRFKTNSPSVTILFKQSGIPNYSHMCRVGSSGFDLYLEEDDGTSVYKGSFIPPFDKKEGYVSTLNIGNGEMKNVCINFPLYSNVIDLQIGLKNDAVLEAPRPYTIEKPIVYYGSSITQGGCASRPGNSYQGFISRRFDCDYLNLGYAGSAKAEPEVSEYIKNLDMSVFVYDYDYNAPSLEHLKDTHETFFKVIRDAHPELPIIMMSRPYFLDDPGTVARREIIEDTYNNALKNGDKNVYFLNGKQLMALCGNDGNVDGCHPNDLGFFSMAQALIGVLEKIMK